jgi:hypothetical protein
MKEPVPEAPAGPTTNHDRHEHHDAHRRPRGDRVRHIHDQYDPKKEPHYGTVLLTHGVSRTLNLSTTVDANGIVAILPQSSVIFTYQEIDFGDLAQRYNPVGK